MRQYIGTSLSVIVVVILGFSSATVAHASATASIVGLNPGSSVPKDTTISFTVQANGFTNPKFWIVDSFPGGVNTSYINSAGDFSWTPNQDEVGTHGLTITVSDDAGNSTTVSQTLTVTGPPSISVSGVTPSGTVMIGTPISFSATPSGFLGVPSYSVGDSFPVSSLRYTAISDKGVVTWTPVAQDVGTHTITVAVRDSYGFFASTSAQVTVLGVPTLEVQQLSPGTSVMVGHIFSFTATSSTLSSPTYSVQDLFNGISTSTTILFDSAAGVASWTPSYNDIGVHHVSVGAVDRTGRSASTTMTITVIPQIPGSTPYVAAATPAVAVVASSSAATTTRSSFVFVRVLTVGSTGADVTALQTVLTSQGVYSGPITGYFGQLTRRAVAAFQTKRGISPVGFVGPATRAALNNI